MNLKLKLSNKYRTKPTGKTIDKIFENVIKEMHRRLETQTNQDKPNVVETENETSASIVIREGKQDFWVDLRSQFGKQNRGYLVELEIRYSGKTVDEETAKELYRKVESILCDVTEIRKS